MSTTMLRAMTQGRFRDGDRTWSGVMPNIAAVVSTRWWMSAGVMGWGVGGVMVKIIAFGRLAYNLHHTYYFALLGKDVFCILVILKTH